MSSRNRSKTKEEVLAALSDVVTVGPSPSSPERSRGQDIYSSAGYSGQAPMMTSEAPPSVPTKETFDPMGASRSKGNKPDPPAKTGMSSKFSQAFKRHTPEEKEAKRREKEKRMHKAIDDSTMKSSRMDIIDQMDLSGINGKSLFHHDSPYDACSPHSNRNSRRAPVMAFDHTIDPMTGQPIGMRATNRPNLSPLAAATMRKMDDSEGANNEGSKSKFGGGQIPTLRMDSTESGSTLSPHTVDDGTSVASHNSVIDRDVDAERAYRQNNYYQKPVKGSKGRSDMANPNADIWGVSSEPWQDFASPAGTSSGGLRPRDSRGTNGRHSGESGSGTASAASSIFDMEAVMTGKKPNRRSTSENASSSLSPEAAGSTAPKRSKSLIKKIKTARQNPNVPPQADELELSSMNLNANSNGRARAASGSNAPRRPGHGYSPSTPPVAMRGVSSPNISSDSGLARNGTLKAGEGAGSYHRRLESTSTDSPPQGSSGLGRSGSIFGRLLSGKHRERGEISAR